MEEALLLIKINYKIHTDAIQENIVFFNIPPPLWGTPFLKGDVRLGGQGDFKNPQSSTSSDSSFPKELNKSSVLRQAQDTSFKKEVGDDMHPAFLYAEKRVQLEQAGFVSELFITSEPSLFFIGEWWKQLMGESHGKEGK